MSFDNLELLCDISIHAPTRGATTQKAAQSRPAAFQSTLPHGERPGAGRANIQTSTISIHAPTRGATCMIAIDLAIRIFQSTLPHGERRGWTYQINDVLQGFQSTLPHGERLRLTIMLITMSYYFNPRSHTGSDIIVDLIIQRLYKFQSTLPHGERPRDSANPPLCCLFQSPLPHGERL